MSRLSACVRQRCPHIKNAYMSAGPYGQCFITLSMQTLGVIFISLSISIVLVCLCNCLLSLVCMECTKSILFVPIIHTLLPFQLGSNRHLIETHFTCPFWWQNILVYVVLKMLQLEIPVCTSCIVFRLLMAMTGDLKEKFNQICGQKETNCFKWFHLAVWLF